MAFQYDYIDPAEFDNSEAAKKLKLGKAWFRIKDASDTKNGYPLLSKKGDPMMRLDIDVTDSDGVTAVLFSYITASMQWKLHELCKSIGHPEMYKDGITTHKLMECTGYCELTSNEDPKYGYQVQIQKFLAPTEPSGEEIYAAAMTQKPPARQLQAKSAPTEFEADDEIPF